MRIVNQRTQMVPLGAVAPHPRNVNQGNIGLIGESISHNGFYGSLVVQQSTGHILRGNHTWQAARQAGATEIPVTYVDVDDETALRILLVDNRATREGADDSNALAALLQELAATPAGLEGSGYDGDALDELLADLGQTGPELRGDPDAVPEVPDDQEPITKRGDIIRLGRHRLMCGDAKNPADIQSLLCAVRPDLILSDPPYGIGVQSWRIGLADGTIGYRPRHLHRPIVGDDAAFDRTSVALQADEELWFGADYYVDTLPNCGKDGAWLVWDKRQDGALDHLSGSAFELCWSKKRRARAIVRITWAGVLGHVRGTDGAGKVHPAQKPVALLNALIEQCSERGAVVADAFLGSGSTLVACEMTERTCYALEIDPTYVDAAALRWEQLTGKTAVREPAAAPAEASDSARVPAGA